MEENKIMTVTDDNNMLLELTGEKKVMYTSLNPENEKEEQILFNASANSDTSVGEMINRTINLRHVFCEMVEIKPKLDKETGEMSEGGIQPRTVLIDENGKSYSTISMGIFTALKKLFAIKGTPDTWDKPVPIEIIQKNIGKNRLFSFILK